MKTYWVSDKMLSVGEDKTKCKVVTPVLDTFQKFFPSSPLISHGALPLPNC